MNTNCKLNHIFIIVEDLINSINLCNYKDKFNPVWDFLIYKYNNKYTIIDI